MRELSSASTTPFRSNLPSLAPERAPSLDPVPRQRPSTSDLQATRESPLTWTLPREPILLEAFDVPKLVAYHHKALELKHQINTLPTRDLRDVKELKKDAQDCIKKFASLQDKVWGTIRDSATQADSPIPDKATQAELEDAIGNVEALSKKLSGITFTSQPQLRGNNPTLKEDAFMQPNASSSSVEVDALISQLPTKMRRLMSSEFEASV
ncbi:MAG: hypothetical protein C5B47_04680 [Verrucomicrobia bacterium]|nr:MAG: hypothetical protein C5B47_04680 [Verrucomicrobiota bacterium]